MGDEKPDFLAQVDQAMAHLATRARLLGNYFHELRGAGFDRAEALALTIELSREIADSEEPDE